MQQHYRGAYVCLCTNHTMAARQPPITGAFLSAKEANQRVDLNTLPADCRWKHIAVTDVIRVDDVYDNAQGDLAANALTDAKGAQWHDYGALANVTLAPSATASRVPISFILQDQVLVSAWTCKDIREDQVATLQKLPGLKNLVQSTWRRARDELIAHVTENVIRWAAVQAVLARTVPSAPFKKKLKGATWVEADPILKGEKTLPPIGGMSAEAQRGMLAVASQVAWAEALYPGKKSICDQALRWYRDDLHIAQDDDEPDVDLDVATQLFRPAPRAVPQDPPGRGDRRPAEVPVHRRPPPGAAAGWKPPSHRLAEEIGREYVNLGGSARTNVRRVLERDCEAPGELRAEAALGDEWTRDLVQIAQEDVLSVGVGCRLGDAIRNADKLENGREIRRQEGDERAEVGKQRGDASLPEEVFLVARKHTRAAVFSATMEACIRTGVQSSGRRRSREDLPQMLSQGCGRAAQRHPGGGPIGPCVVRGALQR